MGKERGKKEEKKGKMKMSYSESEGLRRGAWSDEEDKILVHFITHNGHGTWRNLPKLAGLLRCGKSCRLRWTNYLRPDIRRGPFSPEEENTIIQLHETLGNKWAVIASQLSGRTDNDVKNFWNSHLRKRFANKPPRHRPSTSSKAKPNKSPLTNHMVRWESVRVEAQSRLSTPPNLPTPTISPQASDYFTNLWSSKVGQSFRNANEFKPQSPTSQTSSLTKAESCKKTGSPEMIWECKKESGDGMAYSDTSKSCDQMDDSSDAMMKLLLDFPVGDDDMGFLQEETTNDASNYA